MQTPEAVAAMRRLYELGWGLRRIAGELGCSRNTVKRHLDGGSWRPYRSPVRRRTLGGLESWLAAHFRQHRGNADVVRQELARVYGITVSLRTVERAVRPWREELEAAARATVRFETPPGQQLQIDFGTSAVRMGGELTVVRLFVATLAEPPPVDLRGPRPTPQRLHVPRQLPHATRVSVHEFAHEFSSLPIIQKA